MKALFSILPIALLMLGCGNTESKPDLTNTAPEKDPMESAVEWSKLQNRNGDAYIPNTDKPYSGWARENYDNGQVKVLAEFTDGSVTRLRQWQENGIPKWDIGFTQGQVKVKDVPIESHYDTNESLHNGLTTLWYDNGQMDNERNYKDGKLDGLYTCWYYNGQKWEEVNYKDGKLDGLYTEWYENGQKESEKNYKNDKLVIATNWKPNGEKCPHTNIVEGNGVAVSYYEDGTMRERNTYKKGELVERMYYVDGTMRERNTYKKGVNESVMYRDDGTVTYRDIWKDGEMVESVWYNKDGTMRERETYKKGVVED